MKYTCTKAITTFRGREYVAWFTDDIPIQNGPWKFCGLPGLIVKVNDTQNNYTYELEGVDLKEPFDISIINVPNAYGKDTPIEHVKFIELFNKKVKELDVQSKASYEVFSNGSGFTKHTIPPKMEKY